MGGNHLMLMALAALLLAPWLASVAVYATLVAQLKRRGSSRARAHAGAGDTAAPAPAAGRESCAVPACRPYRFAIVEDDRLMQDLIQDEVTSACNESEASVFCNGLAGLEHIAKEGFDLATVDDRMPGMSGTEMVKRLRAHGISIPLIMVSSDPEAETAARAAGVTAFLDKARLHKLRQLVSTSMPRNATRP